MNQSEDHHERAVNLGADLELKVQGLTIAEAFAAACSSKGTIKRWLVDTGAGQHVVGKEHLIAQQLADVVDVDPLRLITSNGIIEASKATWLYVSQLDLWVQAYIFDNCPPALSAGRLCRDDGCALSWAEGANEAVMTTKGGARVQVSTIKH